jgi:catechol 2,3-dioxygenase-like lactoylglutathione lyase family enzyme
MSRIQLALNVSDLDEAVEFYSRIFGTEPHKTRPGYANFALDNPPLKLVLFEGAGEPGTVNHLGVEVESTDEVMSTQARLAGEAIPNRTEESVECCYAVQDKVWADAPDGISFEVYTILDDLVSDDAAACGCGTSPDPVAESDAAPEMNVGGCCAPVIDESADAKPVAAATGCC